MSGARTFPAPPTPTVPIGIWSARHRELKSSGCVLDLVIPALNEEHRIGPTLDTICGTAAARQWSLRVIVVDNGCVDATLDAVASARSHDIPIEVIGCKTRGKGAAVRAGVEHAVAPYVGYCDADLSTPPDVIGTAADLLALGWDVVVGSRRCVGASYEVTQPPLRRIGGVVFRSLARRILPTISDTQCGFKVFRTPVAKRVFALSFVDGFAFDVEVLARAVNLGYSVTELPVSWSDRSGSTLRPRADGLQAFLDLRYLTRSLRAAPSEASRL